MSISKNGIAIVADERLTIVRKTADETVNNSDTLQNDDHLLFAVAANKVWEFSIVVYMVTLAASDFQWNLTGPAGSAIVSLKSYVADRVGIATSGVVTDALTGIGLVISGIIINGQ